MSNIAGALYTVTKIKNEMKCSRRMRSVSRQCQFKQPCLQAAPEGKKWRRVPNSRREAVPGACIKSLPECRSASECSHFWTRLSFWSYLAPIKYHDGISNGSWINVLTNKHTYPPTHTHRHRQTDLTENSPTSYAINVNLLLLLVCMSWTITGQLRNSVFIRRV